MRWGLGGAMGKPRHPIVLGQTWALKIEIDGLPSKDETLHLICQDDGRIFRMACRRERYRKAGWRGIPTHWEEEFRKCPECQDKTSEFQTP